MKQRGDLVILSHRYLVGRKREAVKSSWIVLSDFSLFLSSSILPPPPPFCPPHICPHDNQSPVSFSYAYFFHSPLPSPNAVHSSINPHAGRGGGDAGDAGTRKTVLWLMSHDPGAFGAKGSDVLLLGQNLTIE